MKKDRITSIREIKVGDFIEYTSRYRKTWCKGHVLVLGRNDGSGYDDSVWCHWEGDNKRPKEHLSYVRVSDAHIRFVTSDEMFKAVLEREIWRLREEL